MKFILQSAITGRIRYVQATDAAALKVVLIAKGFALPRDDGADCRVIFPEELPRVAEYIPPV